MEKTKFFAELKEILELDGSVNDNTILHLSSLEILSVIVLIDENFEKQIRDSDLKSVKTVLSLIDLIGKDKFE